MVAEDVPVSEATFVADTSSMEGKGKLDYYAVAS